MEGGGGGAMNKDRSKTIGFSRVIRAQVSCRVIDLLFNKG